MKEYYAVKLSNGEYYPKYEKTSLRFQGTPVGLILFNNFNDALDHVSYGARIIKVTVSEKQIFNEGQVREKS